MYLSLCSARCARARVKSKFNIEFYHHADSLRRMANAENLNAVQKRDSIQVTFDTESIAQRIALLSHLRASGGVLHLLSPCLALRAAWRDGSFLF